MCLLVTIIPPTMSQIARFIYILIILYNTACVSVLFYQRRSIASYASAGIALVEMSVCLSVRLFHSDVVSKQRKLMISSPSESPNVLHRVPKLATPLASNTLNSVWSSWISTKYCTLHYLNITYCHTYYDIRTLPCMLTQCNVILSSEFADYMGWTWPAQSSSVAPA